MRSIATDRVAWSVGRLVGLSVGLSVTLVSPVKTAEQIEIPFGLKTRVGPRNHVWSVLSVSLCATLVYYGQTVGWIKMPLGNEVGLGPGHTVLDRYPAPPKERDTAATPPLSRFTDAGKPASV